MKLLLAGGGTGGHLFPAVALAERLKQEEPDSEVLFVGTQKGLEARLLPKLGWRLKTIEMSGWAGLGLRARALSLRNLVKGLKQSRQILKEYAPDVIVGVGGYSSVPVLLAATWMKMPYLIHEQNAWPGLANRLLGRWAKRVCLSFEEAGRAFPGKRTVVTGNPVRSAMERCPELDSKPPVLLVFGGSHGARAINRSMIEALPHLQSLHGELKIIHQTGQLDFEEVVCGYQKGGWTDVDVQPFITEMPEAYKNATLVVCRAGATTLAELTACGRPAILIPYPFATGRHQSINAQALAARGAAILLEEKDLTADRLGKLITDLLGDAGRLHSMAAAGRSLARTGAAARLLDECRKLLNSVNGTD
jgi:UDP-N-acetylglucosamine--N-acetylmuramyl-(pentapeptide) pyrophosphoryl-undecaprenol N-acetylglucosamine transferase